MERFARTKCQEISKAKRCYSTFACKLQYALKGRVFKNRIKIWYKKWCYIGVSKLLIFNTLTYKIALCKFA